jgi:hemerythrin-like metal-binding protein
MADHGAVNNVRMEITESPTPGKPCAAWTPAMSVHSPTLDLHHQILIGCLKRMVRLQEDWRDSLPAVRRELALIANYCRIHFFVEESAMRCVGLDDGVVATHKDKHRRILSRMTDLTRAFQADPLAFPFAESLDFLKAWLSKHIVDEDRQDYADALRADPSVEETLAQYRYAEISRKLNLTGGIFGRAGGQDLSGRLVTVIEGDPERRDGLADVLRDQGLAVTVLEGLVEARTVCEVHTPELLFLDWALPGAPALAHCLYRTSNTAVVACHAGSPLDIIDACDVEGAANILSCPCAAGEIVAVTRETLDGLAPMRALVRERLSVAAGDTTSV